MRFCWVDLKVPAAKAQGITAKIAVDKTFGSSIFALGMQRTTGQADEMMTVTSSRESGAGMEHITAHLLTRYKSLILGILPRDGKSVFLQVRAADVAQQISRELYIARKWYCKYLWGGQMVRAPTREYINATPRKQPTKVIVEEPVLKENEAFVIVTNRTELEVVRAAAALLGRMHAVKEEETKEPSYKFLPRKFRVSYADRRSAVLAAGLRVTFEGQMLTFDAGKHTPEEANSIVGGEGSHRRFEFAALVLAAKEQCDELAGETAKEKTSTSKSVTQGVEKK